MFALNDTWNKADFLTCVGIDPEMTQSPIFAAIWTDLMHDALKLTNIEKAKAEFKDE